MSGTNAIQQTGASSSNSYYGIFFNNNNGASLIISSDTNGTLNVSGGQATGGVGYSYGIDATGSVSVEGNATVTATGGTATYSSSYGSSYGIYADGSVSVGDSATVTATGGQATYESDGIYANGLVSVGGNATVTATSGTATGEDGYSCGIFASGTVSVEGNAMLTATGGTATGTNGLSYGIFAYVSVSVGDNATVTATGGTATDESGQSYGIFAASGSVSVGGSAMLTATGEVSGIRGTTVKNEIAGVGWTNTAGTAGGARIEISADGQYLSDYNYKKVAFPAYTVTFNSGGGFDVTSIIVASGDKITKPTDPTRTGYDFNGWYKEAEFTNAWNFETDTVSKDITLYAKWTPVTYSISYELNGGTVSTANPAIYDITSDDITLNNPTRNGYQFDGWTGTDLTSKTQTVTIAKGNTGERSYTANFTPIKYAITYNLDGGTNNSENPAEYTVESDTINLKAPTKDGYEFTGWTPDGVINKGSTGEKTFTANFVIIFVSDDVKSDDIKSGDVKPVTSDDEAVKAIETLLSGDKPLDEKQVNEVISKLESVSNDVTLNSKEAETLVKSILANESNSGGASTLTQAQIETVAKAIVSDDGKIATEAMTELTNSLATKDSAGATTLTAGALTSADSTAAKIAVAALASSVENSGTKKELNLETVALTSLSGIDKLLKQVVAGSSTTASTSELTLDLGKVETLKTVDNLENVSLKAITLENNTSVKEVKLDGATVQNVDMKGSKVTEVSLNASSNVKEIDASGAAELTSIDLASNEKIVTLNISETNVSELNAAGCAGLENLTADGGSEGAGELKEVNLEGCVSLKKLALSNNKLLGVKKPSGFTKPDGFTFKARGQKRTSETKFSAGMNFFEFIFNLWKATLSAEDAADKTYETASADAPVDFNDIVSVKADGNNVSFDADGRLSAGSAAPTTSFSYELDPFGLTKTSVKDGSVSAAAEDDGMEVTISGEGEESNGISGSGGGCEIGLGFGVLSALAVFIARKQGR